MIYRSIFSALAASACIVALATPAAAQTRSYDIPASDLPAALDQFAQQSGAQIVYKVDEVRGKRSKSVKGSYEADDALRRLLSGSGFEARRDGSGAFAVVRVGNGEGGADIASSSREADAVPEDQRGISEILVVGSRSQNVDIRRTEDDAQPYMVFSSKDIEQSGLTNVEDYLRSRLPANTQSVGTLQDQGLLASESSGRINLRGLGSQQTLILIDGRRAPGVFTRNSFAQANINGIPLGAIERIEVLPSTASGIYGGGATGGVVNIILKRNYSGIDAEISHGESFRGDSDNTSVSISGGASLFTGNQVTFSIARSRQDALNSNDRRFATLAGRLLLKNAPTSALLPSFGWGALPNVFSATPNQTLVLDTMYGGVDLHSAQTSVPLAYGGAATDAGQRLLDRAGLIDLRDARNVLYESPESASYSLNIRQNITKNLDLYVDANLDRSKFERDSPQSVQLTIAAANNPFQQIVRVNLPIYDFVLPRSSSVKNDHVASGLIIRLPKNWAATLEYAWSSTKLNGKSQSILAPTLAGRPILEAAAFNTTSLSEIANFRPLFNILNSSFTSTTNLSDYSIRGSGPLAKLPAGNIVMTVLGEYRQNTSGNTFDVSKSDTISLSNWTPPASQNVISAYAEISVPIVSKINQLPFVRNLEMTAALRRDRYRTRYAQQLSFATEDDLPIPTYTTNKLESTDVTLTGKFSPVYGITFRASYGTGFAPPDLSQISPITQTVVTSTPSVSRLVDPLRGNSPLTGDPATGLITLISSGNPNLKPERSRSISYGVVIEPRFLPGLRVSLDTTEIRKNNEITTLAPQFFLDNSEQYPERVTRAPSLPGDIYGVGPVTSLNSSLVNLLKTKVRATDFQLDYNIVTNEFGTLHPYVIGTYQRALSKQVSIGVPRVNTVGLADGPLKWRANFGLDWDLGPVEIRWNAQYYSGYSLCASSQTSTECVISPLIVAQGTTKIPSQTYHDLSVRYAFDRSHGALHGVELLVGVQNMFDKRPPIIIGALGYSSYGDPRLRRFQITLRKKFGR